MAKKENNEIKKAMEIIEEMSMDPKEWELYQSRQLAILDYNTGILEAQEEIAKKIAKKLLSKNMSIEEISEITGLDLSTIKNLNFE